MTYTLEWRKNFGSGFPKILDAWKDAKWNAPTLEDRLTTEEVRLTLPIPFAEFTTETTTQKPVENSDVNKPNVADIIGVVL